MHFWITTICILSLNLMVSINASKKADLERAAELAVERAAERVAERAVEKALEAGNSTTTTITVKEGYSNARKVAEEQAAPGSESTRYKHNNHEYTVEYSGEVQPNAHGNSTEYEEGEDDGRKVAPVHEETDFEWDEEEAHGREKYGLKEKTKPSKKGEAKPEYKEEEVEVREPEEELFHEDGEDISHEKTAWRAYSKWENSFKKPQKQNWPASKSFWSGEDSFFWDMEDAETRHNLKKPVKNLTVSEPHAGESENHVWRNKNFPQKGILSWDTDQKTVTTSERPETTEKSTRNNAHQQAFPYQAEWTNRKVAAEESWKDQENYDEENNKSNDYKDESDRKYSVENLWKASEDFQMDSWSDSETSEKEAWLNQDSNTNADKQSNRKVEEEKPKLLQFWASGEGPKVDSREIKEFLQTGQWNLRDILAGTAPTKTEDGKPVDPDVGAEMTTDATNLYSTLWRKNKLKSAFYDSLESGTAMPISKRSTIHNDKRNYLNKNKTYPITADNYRPKKTAIVKEIEKTKEKQVPQNYYKNYYPRQYPNVPPVYDPEAYRIYAANQDILKVQVPPKAPTVKRQKLKAVPETYTGYILGPYKPFRNTYDHYINQVRYQNQYIPFRVKKQLPLYYHRTQYPPYKKANKFAPYPINNNNNNNNNNRYYNRYK